MLVVVLVVAGMDVLVVTVIIELADGADDLAVFVENVVAVDVYIGVIFNVFSS